MIKRIDEDTIEISTVEIVKISELESELKDLEVEQKKLDALELWADKLTDDQKRTVDIPRHYIEIDKLKTNIAYYKELKIG